MAHAQESGHWYDSSGNPVWEVSGAKGQSVKPDIRHARKLGLLPGVTTITRQAAAPGLVRWQVEQGILAALTLPRRQDEAESDWLTRVRQDSQEQAKKAAVRGTAVHASVQSFFEGDQPAEEYWEHCRGTAAAVKAWAEPPLWLAEKSFSHPLGFGGKTDLYGDGFLLDFKSKEFDETTKLDTYEEQHMQLAANREGQMIPRARCAIVYVSVTVPGLAKVIEIEQDKLVRGWSMFLGLLAYWKSKNGIV